MLYRLNVVVAAAIISLIFFHHRKPRPSPTGADRRLASSVRPRS